MAGKLHICNAYKQNVMKKLLSASLLLFLLGYALPGCQPDETTEPTDDRDKFVAAWTCAENSSQTQNSSFTVDINKSASVTTQIEIENFYNVGFSNKAKAEISGSSLTIPSQLYSGKQIHGSGTMVSNNTITMTYYVDLGSGTIDTCTATLTRQ